MGFITGAEANSVVQNQKPWLNARGQSAQLDV